MLYDFDCRQFIRWNFIDTELNGAPAVLGNIEIVQNLYEFDNRIVSASAVRNVWQRGILVSENLHICMGIANKVSIPDGDPSRGIIDIRDARLSVNNDDFRIHTWGGWGDYQSTDIQYTSPNGGTLSTPTAPNKSLLGVNFQMYVFMDENPNAPAADAAAHIRHVISEAQREPQDLRKMLDLTTLSAIRDKARQNIK